MKRGIIKRIDMELCNAIEEQAKKDRTSFREASRDIARSIKRRAGRMEDLRF